MSDVALAVPAPAPSTDKRKAVRIQGKLRQALDVMVWEGLPYDDAARSVNLHVRSMRQALAKSHVLAYLHHERHVLRASLAPRNIHRLREIRDAADNMPAVQAIKVLEQLGDEQTNKSGASVSPGVTIRIVNVQQPNTTYHNNMSDDAQATKQINHIADGGTND